ncbi:MAG: LytTR family DNA-binding domain-containing protein [Bacteroidota bacterium]
MKVAIIEDEKYARTNLEEMIQEIEPGVQIVAALDNVNDSVAWLKNNECDLIFLDIHLADDVSFNIFHRVTVKTPIIFTTAYDQYAIKAFKVNSVDYLLKPIDKEELREAMQKFHRLHPTKNENIEALRQSILAQNRKTYQGRFMVKKGEKIGSIKTEDIAYFEGEDRYVYLVNKKNERFFVDYKLADLEELLDPNVFFRFNRSFIGQFDSINNIITLSKSRVKVNLSPQARREIVVSTENTRLFKEWLNR